MEKSMTGYLNEIYSNNNSMIDDIIGKRYDEFYDFYFGSKNISDKIKSLRCNTTKKKLSLGITLYNKEDKEEFTSGLSNFETYMRSKFDVGMDDDNELTVDISISEIIESVED